MFIIKIKKYYWMGVLAVVICQTSKAEGIKVIMSAENKFDPPSKKEIQDYYHGNADRLKQGEKQGAKIKLCKREEETVRDSFYKGIDSSESKAESNRSLLQSTGRASTIVNVKPLSSSKEALNYVANVNKDSGICYLGSTEFNELSDSEKKMVKVILEKP